VNEGRSRYQIHVRGTVQGVGFRPFIYRLARDLGLAGWVRNDSSGVVIEVEGPRECLERFLERLPTWAWRAGSATTPPGWSSRSRGRGSASSASSSACRARRLLWPTSRQSPTSPSSRRASGSSSSPTACGCLTRWPKSRPTWAAEIPPDMGICDDCLRELLDPADRRYLYPFINCTNCGPRFTIAESLPYDRPFTSMKIFKMCPRCQAEYDDPADRRFHAQPNACWDCGPRLSLLDPAGNPVETEDPIATVAEALHAGKIAAIKGLGGFHLAVDATNDAAVRTLRERKWREKKPFAIMVPDLEAARRVCELTEPEVELLTSFRKPIVLSRKRPGPGIARSVAPASQFFGIMLPYTPLHVLLMRHGFLALVMTSANRTDEPIAIANDEALERLGSVADTSQGPFQSTSRGRSWRSAATSRTPSA